MLSLFKRAHKQAVLAIDWFNRPNYVYVAVQYHSVERPDVVYYIYCHSAAPGNSIHQAGGMVPKHAPTAGLIVGAYSQYASP
jgi:hypothetical protein